MNKQIEEMAKDLEKIEKEQGHKLLNETLSYVNKNHRYNSKEDYLLAHKKTIYELTAEELIKQGYQKVDKDKDSVVLTKEEYERLKTYIAELEKQNFKLNVDSGFFKEENEHLAKDSYCAELNLQHITRELDNIRKETAKEILQQLNGHGTTYVKKWIKEQYGVEIKK